MYRFTFYKVFVFGMMIIASNMAYSQTYTVQLYPYDEELAEQMNYYAHDYDIEFVKKAERNEFYLGRLEWDSTSHHAFLSPSSRSYENKTVEPQEDRGPSDIPYQTKPHRMRQLRQDAGLNVDKQGNIVGSQTSLEDTDTDPSEITETDVEDLDETDEKKPGIFSRLFGGKDKKVNRKNPPNDGGRVVIARPEARLSGASVLNELPEYQSVMDEAQTESLQSSSSVSSDALVPRMPGAEYDESIVNLSPSNSYRDENEKGILGKVVDTLTIPFRDSDSGNSKNRSYTISSEFAFPNGRNMSLPDVKTRDREEMRHLFAQLGARSAEWLVTGNTDKISALNKSVSIRNSQELSYKFQRAEQNTYWDQPTKRNQIDTVKSTVQQ